MDSVLRKMAIQTARAHLEVWRIERAALTQGIGSPETPSAEKDAAYQRLAQIELESQRLEDELELLIAENPPLEH